MQLGEKCGEFLRGRKKLKIDIRLSPNAKVDQAEELPKSRRTGVATSRKELPQSTNVSSPVQAKSKRRANRGLEKEDAGNVARHGNGYERDDFVVSDDNSFRFETDDNEDEAAFEPVRDVGQPVRSRKRQLGPPITTDTKLDRLNDIHRMMVDTFVAEAKQMSEKVGHYAWPTQTCHDADMIRFCWIIICATTLSRIPFCGKWPSAFLGVRSYTPCTVSYAADTS